MWTNKTRNGKKQNARRRAYIKTIRIVCTSAVCFLNIVSAQAAKTACVCVGERQKEWAETDARISFIIDPFVCFFFFFGISSIWKGNKQFINIICSSVSFFFLKKRKFSFAIPLFCNTQTHTYNTESVLQIHSDAHTVSHVELREFSLSNKWCGAGKTRTRIRFASIRIS